MAGDFSFSPLGRGLSGLRPRFAASFRSAMLRGLLTAIVCVLASVVVCASAQATKGIVTRTFSEEGGESGFVVPAGVESVKVVAIGGAGGAPAESSGEGGLGARVAGDLSVTPGQVLYVEVGYEGSFTGPIALDGGGSSDVRTAPKADGLSPDDRLIVAGAGGGAGEEKREDSGNGGNAGDAEGEAGEEGISAGGGGGGTLTGGGFGGELFLEEFKCNNRTEPEAGKLEAGGRGGRCLTDGGIEGGQGGAGYYGGGGGAAGFSGAGGGGGSSLVPAGGKFGLAREESAQVQIIYTQPPNPPAVVTEAASEIRRETASLNATVDPEDEEVTNCTFEYGTSEFYGASAPCSTSPGSGIAPVEVSAHLTGLTPETIYHYRIVATSANGVGYGGEETFTTPKNEPPEVTGIDPEAGPTAGGETVTISGSELEEATAVKFGSTPAKSFTVDSSESIVAVAPAGTGTVSLYVTTPSGTSSGGVHFTFLPRPSVATITPDTGPAAGGTTVKIFGSGFDAASSVSFGASVALSVTFDSATELTAVTPPGAETVYVTVTTPDAGTSADAENVRFGYESGAPEYGVCVFGPKFVDEFTDSKCEHATSSGGKYRWDPGAEKDGFTAASSGAVTLETVSRAKVVCASAAITGTITSEGVSGETILFKGCASGASACTGPGLAAGEVTTSTLQGVLAWENKSKGKVVLALTPTVQPFMRYTCAGSAPTTVTGSILMPVKAGKMQTTLKLKLKASKGKQKPESLEDGEKHVLSSSTGGGLPEQTGLTLGATQENEEAVEINPAV
jgi:hypothetical protein